MSSFEKAEPAIHCRAHFAKSASRNNVRPFVILSGVAPTKAQDAWSMYLQDTQGSDFMVKLNGFDKEEVIEGAAAIRLSPDVTRDEAEQLALDIQKAVNRTPERIKLLLKSPEHFKAISA